MMQPATQSRLHPSHNPLATAIHGEGHPYENQPRCVSRLRKKSLPKAISHRGEGSRPASMLTRPRPAREIAVVSRSSSRTRLSLGTIPRRVAFRALFSVLLGLFSELHLYHTARDADAQASGTLKLCCETFTETLIILALGLEHLKEKRLFTF